MAKVLVVDDSETERNHMRTVLAKAGHEVFTAASGREGTELAQSHRPDLIFMDIVMDDMDGYKATRAIREDAGTASIPIVVVSSKNQKADKMWAQLQGAKAYLVKPAGAEDILRFVAQFTSGSGAPR